MSLLPPGELPDDELLELERLLQQSLRRSAALKRVVQTSRAKLSEKEVSEDYALRLADKALFRKLLEDNALDGMRFRWLFSCTKEQMTHILHVYYTLDSVRKYIDSQIVKEEPPRGPAS